jgi:hypothetical protein
VPAGVDGISVGLSIRRVGSMTVDDQELLDPSAATAIAAGKSAGTGASAKNASAPVEIVSRVPVLGEDGENEYDEAAFAGATTSGERTTLTDATGCSSGGAGPLSLALMAAALASRARTRWRIRRI